MNENFKPAIHEPYSLLLQQQNQCAYDLDEVDVAWLTAYNQSRALLGYLLFICSSSGVVVLAKIDPCDMCGKRFEVNCVRCKTCKKWVHALCARVKKVFCKVNTNFECRVCMNDSKKECNNFLKGCLSEFERVNNYCYLGDNMNGGKGSEVAVTGRIGLGWRTLNSMSSMLCGERHTWNIKAQIYSTCVRPVWLRNLGGKIPWRKYFEKSRKRMLRMICGGQLADGVSTKEFMVRLQLDNTIIEVGETREFEMAGSCCKERVR